MNIKAAGLLVLSLSYSLLGKTVDKEVSVYKVKQLETPMEINGNWNKPQWRKVKEIQIRNFMGLIPSFRPKVQAKMMYDKQNIYVIFLVHDRYVRNMIEDYNGPVSSDACVEFFFSPDMNFTERYFNLEINSGGTPLMGYHTDGRKKYQLLEHADLDKIEISHSLPKKLEKEITEPITWTIEYRLPLSVLQKFSNITAPEPGVVWRGNFYKTSSMSSNPHWMTWSVVNNPKPDFHLPQFFGILKFI
ncbi:MAG: hypothetical protein JWN56_1258 [Sphingobacteriales bacterium]|nr:hypothetical protein [Sphingobacteriales bacterium]